MKEGRKEGMEEGRKEGKREAREEVKIDFAALTVKTIESAMKSFNIDLTTACKAVDIPIEEYEKAKTLLSMQETK